MAIFNKKKELVVKSFEQRNGLYKNMVPVLNKIIKTRMSVHRVGQVLETKEEKDEYNKLKSERK